MILKIILFAIAFVVGLGLGWLIIKSIEVFTARAETAYEGKFMKTDRSMERTEWFYRSRTENVRTVLLRALDRSKELDMALMSFKRVDK